MLGDFEEPHVKHGQYSVELRVSSLVFWLCMPLKSLFKTNCMLNFFSLPPKWHSGRQFGCAPLGERKKPRRSWSGVIISISRNSALCVWTAEVLGEPSCLIPLNAICMYRVLRGSLWEFAMKEKSMERKERSDRDSEGWGVGDIWEVSVFISNGLGA